MNFKTKIADNLNMTRIRCLGACRVILPLFVAFTFMAGLVALAQQKTPPSVLIFEAKTGNAAYNHALHAKREKDDCKVCHDQVFQQAKVPLNYKAAMHKTAETAKKSCGFCHNAGGKAFATKGNCNKCHVKGSA